MENNTYDNVFHLVPFSAKPANTPLIVCVFFLLYIFEFLINTIIITVIYIDANLHSPMYIFLCNLALVDICFTTTTVPKLLYLLLSRNNTVSFIQCFTQLYCYNFVGSIEDVLIFVMAYDRYVAICNPLHYHNILNKKICILITTAIWIFGCLNSAAFTITASNMSFCHSHTINQFYCDAKALINISCSGTKNFYIVIFLEFLLLGLFPFLFCVTSYIRIIRVILQIKSKDGRKKAFSTCSSHLTIVMMYYTTGLSVYMMPPSEYSNVLEPILTTLYAVVIPMMNPLIYSLRNKDIKISLQRLLGIKQITEKNLAEHSV